MSSIVRGGREGERRRIRRSSAAAVHQLSSLGDFKVRLRGY